MEATGNENKLTTRSTSRKRSYDVLESPEETSQIRVTVPSSTEKDDLNSSTSSSTIPKDTESRVEHMVSSEDKRWKPVCVGSQILM